MVLIIDMFVTEVVNIWDTTVIYEYTKNVEGKLMMAINILIIRVFEILL
jgi:hypothetical protein